MEQRKSFRIFISSPGDVRPERLIARRVVDRLDREFQYHCRVQAILWERLPLVATENFQEGIPEPSAADIVVVVIWSRLGTVLPTPNFVGPLSQRAVTGTEWEFEDAFRASRERGLPDLLVYRKSAPVMTRVGSSDEAEALQQKAMVDGFFRQWFMDADGQSFVAASHSFERPTEFEEMLETHLRDLLLARIGGAPELHGIRWHKGSPFRGLESFELQHAEIFFGRTKARNEIREALAAQLTRRRAFLLVLGGSGSGKSSLIKAGVLPDLMLPGMLPRVGLCRHAIFRPSDTPDNPVQSLAHALLSESALPELAEQEYRVGDLGELLGNAPAQARQPISQALAAAAAHAKLASPWEARLILVVDQLEELFAPAIAPTQREAFVTALEALAYSEHVWVIATMRSDFFDRLEALPRLASLSEAGGRYLLTPASDAELGQMIRQPANEAGLTFERHAESGLPLDEELRSAAAGDPGVLPLLEFTLEQLWRQRTDRGVLTYSAYRHLDGLAGAIGNRAEEIFRTQPEDVQAALPRLIFALASIEQSETGRVIARTVSLDSFPAGSLVHRLVQAFLAPDARLLVADGTAATPRVRVAHEALLLHWPRAKAQIEQDRQDLLVRARLELALRQWQAAEPKDKRSLLLPSGSPLSQAEHLLHRQRAELAPDLVQFIEDSVAGDRRRLRNLRIAVVAFATLAFAAIVAAGFGWFEQNAAQTQLQTAEKNQSLFMADESRRLAAQGDQRGATLVALAALPKSIANPDRPFVQEAADALLQAVASSPQSAGSIVLVPQSAQLGTDALFGTSGRLVLGTDYSGAVHIWDTATGAEKQILTPPDLCPSKTLRISGNEQVVALACGQKVAFWNQATGQAFGSPLPITATVTDLELDNAGAMAIVATQDGKAIVWDISAARQKAAAAPSGGQPLRAMLGGDGRSALLWWQNGAALMDVASGALHPLTGISGFVAYAAFSPDARHVALGSSEGSLGIWDATTGQETLPLSGKPGAPVLAIRYRPDGRQLIIGQQGNEQLNKPTLLRAQVPEQQPVFSGNGNLLLMPGSLHAWTLFDADTGRPVFGVPPNAGTPTVVDVSDGSLVGSLGYAVYWQAAFTPDARSVLTASQDVRRWPIGSKGTAQFFQLAGLQPRGGVFTADPATAIVFADGANQIVHFGKTTTHETIAGNVVRLNGERTFAVLSYPDQSVHLWNLAEAKDAGQWPRLGGGNAVLSGDGSRVLWVTLADTVLLTPGHQPVHFPQPIASQMGSALLLHDGSRAVTISQAGQALLWNIADPGHVVRVGAVFTDVSLTMANTTGTMIVLGHSDGSLQIIDPATGGQRSAIAAVSGGGLTLLDGIGDGARIIIRTAPTGPLRLLRSSDGQVVGEMPELRSHLTMRASNDGRRLLTFGNTGSPQLWDGETGKLVAALPVQGQTSGAVFGDSDRVIGTSSSDGTVAVWRATDGSLMLNLDSKLQALSDVVFSGDGQYILATSPMSNSAVTWYLPHGQRLLDYARSEVGTATTEERQHYLLPAVPP